MEFEWDRAKAERNLKKHEVAFDEGVTVFYDPLAATFNDPDDSSGERRLITIGYSSKDRLLVVVHTEQGQEIRIISVRPATAHERRNHET